ncbi:MAG: hypothetical protein ACXWJK_17870 [Burkholderiaceae bacterium]
MTKRSSLSPEDYLAQHEITAKLKKAGLSDSQLDGVHFKKHEGDPFSIWRVRSKHDWPNDQLSEMRVWCTLRWLIMEDPPASHDRDEAWNEVSTYMAAPLHKSGQNHLRHAKIAGEESQENAQMAAQAFVKAVNALRQENTHLSKTDAIKKVAANMNIGVSTGWGYFSRLGKPEK